ncbi:Isoprenyl transferase [Propionispora sp. 2/2-37]|uniref:isoprenyl transferase n=1 Tax=Propionispora sp. 2/2-37 TaxID=1677858 RepID=UPI0006BB5939|nr:isoprenyl transferase [Propionispora sp. 2/2-37]CUH96124.1 Isoprenyl transferase [Propionispora sp. 2/2-37]
MWKKWFGKSSIRSNEKILNSQIDRARIPEHIAIIMDGNGRWAQKKGMPRTYGHSAGVEALRQIVRTASDIQVKILTVYAFSTENWKRPKEEVNFLMKLFSDFLDSEIDELDKNCVQIRFIGKIEELSSRLQSKIEKARTRTMKNQGLVLNLAVNYGGRAELKRAVQIIAQEVQSGKLYPEEIDEKTIQNCLYTADLPDPDLLIRPGGDFRISNFLLWQLAYTEFWSTSVHWPDFTPGHFIQAIVEFQQRERRFGGLKRRKDTDNIK